MLAGDGEKVLLSSPNYYFDRRQHLLLIEYGSRVSKNQKIQIRNE
jgi:hypothetical protein